MRAEDARARVALHDKRAMADTADSEGSRIRFDCETVVLDLGTHKYQLSLRDHQAHEGRQEVILLAPLMWYDDRREDSWVHWEEGHNEGWDAGCEEGFKLVEVLWTAGFEEDHEMGSGPR